MAGRFTRLTSPSRPRNIVLDEKTVAAMVRTYCRDVHRPSSGQLCDACAALLEYAYQRLAGCPFGPEKTTCRECPIHCYRPAQRSAMKDVMRHAGPRMLWRHPWLALRHLWIDRKGPPRWPPYTSRRHAARGHRIRAGSSLLAILLGGFFPGAGEYSRRDTPARPEWRGIGPGRPDRARQRNCTSGSSHDSHADTSPAS
jgi:YbgA-like uncharacterized protein